MLEFSPMANLIQKMSIKILPPITPQVPRPQGPPIPQKPGR